MFFFQQPLHSQELFDAFHRKLARTLSTSVVAARLLYGWLLAYSRMKLMWTSLAVQLVITFQVTPQCGRRSGRSSLRGSRGMVMTFKMTMTGLSERCML